METRGALSHHARLVDGAGDTGERGGPQRQPLGSREAAQMVKVPPAPAPGISTGSAGVRRVITCAGQSSSDHSAPRQLGFKKVKRKEKTSAETSVPHNESD